MASYPRLEKNHSWDFRSTAHRGENALLVGKRSFPALLGAFPPRSKCHPHFRTKAKALLSAKKAGTRVLVYGQRGGACKESWLCCSLTCRKFFTAQWAHLDVQGSEGLPDFPSLRSKAGEITLKLLEGGHRGCGAQRPGGSCLTTLKFNSKHQQQHQ